METSVGGKEDSLPSLPMTPESTNGPSKLSDEDPNSERSEQFIFRIKYKLIYLMNEMDKLEHSGYFNWLVPMNHFDVSLLGGK